MEKYCPRCFQTYDADATTCPADGTTLVGNEESDLIGEVIDGRYQILDLIGQGGMGVVYKAEQDLINRVVALKVLRREIVRDASQVKRFLTEAKAIASLTSPNTVTLYDFGVTSEGLLYYTMELLEGRSLGDLIEEEGPLSHLRAAEIMYQACDSLAEAHDLGILHRDIKPDNIFVSSAREGGDRVRVLDFGIAKLMDDGGHGTVTQTGMICGTPAYLAPEVALGEDVGQSSDLYSLGITLYEVLAGEPPFTATTSMKLLLQQVNDEPPSVSEVNPEVEVPASFERFLRVALAKKPGERFADVSAFRAGLEDAVQRQHEAPSTGRIPALQTTNVGTRGIADSKIALEDTAPAEVLESRPAKTSLEVPAVVDIEPLEEPPASPDEGGTWARTSWMLSLGLGALLVVGLALWQPWRSTDEPPELTPVQTEAPPEPVAAEVLAPAPAVDPVADRAHSDSEFEARVLAAEEAARQRVEAEATLRAMEDEARSEAERVEFDAAMKAAASEAADDARRKIEAEIAQQEADAAAARRSEEEAASKAAALAAAEKEAEAAARLKAEAAAAKEAEEARRRRAARKRAAAKAAAAKLQGDGFVTIPIDDPAPKDPPPEDSGFVTLPE